MRPYHDERYKWFAPFGIVRYTDEDGNPIGTPGGDGLPRLEDGVDQGAWLCGSPEEILARLRSWEERYPGLEHVVIHWAEGNALERVRGAAADLCGRGHAAAGHLAQPNRPLTVSSRLVSRVDRV